ncbi:putative G-protein coupled receptor [Favolaschia claudopus]|uniref:G-protein coupled receptor n=1 Tax=Favolaschia claudopus TaxID=2862362 RepID=A0AAW0AHN1_9AGAR
MATQASRRFRTRRRLAASSPSPASSLIALVDILSALRQRMPLPSLSLRWSSPTSSLPLPTKREQVEEDPAVIAALVASSNGSNLITASTLPPAWQHSPYTLTSYRFIPLSRPGKLVGSIFEAHNEFLNIQTHLAPLLLFLLSLFFPSAMSTLLPFPFTPLNSASTTHADLTSTLFTLAAMLCLGSSVIWHTMSGCAHQKTMRMCARVDYVGIGWLISASISTIILYSYAPSASYPDLSLHPAAYPLLALCLITAIMGTVFPFMKWFDRYENRASTLLRLRLDISCVSLSCPILLSLILTSSFLRSVCLLIILTNQHASPTEHITPTLTSCGIGVIFYALHIPERFFISGSAHEHHHMHAKSLAKWAERMESVGFGSHAIWHLFIALGIAQWRAALPAMREGVVLRALS